MLGLHCWVGFSLVAENGGYSRVAVHEVLIEVVSLSSEHGLKGAQASAIAAYVLSSCISWVLEHRLNSCVVWASLLHIMWGLPTSGIKPMSPLWAGGLFTTELPGKLPNLIFFLWLLDLFEASDSIDYRLSTRSWKSLPSASFISSPIRFLIFCLLFY